MSFSTLTSIYDLTAFHCFSLVPPLSPFGFFTSKTLPESLSALGSFSNHKHDSCSVNTFSHVYICCSSRVTMGLSATSLINVLLAWPARLGGCQCIGRLGTVSYSLHFQK
ncbi:hypothetical protein GOODEAATRI_008721 [Goodea atripinnis]|uniref:Uncharacterized protein n=1 Tax=Goodea atripinnis TaxID=208336 RepID=A0ABV0PCI5_9TELE